MKRVTEMSGMRQEYINAAGPFQIDMYREESTLDWVVTLMWRNPVSAEGKVAKLKIDDRHIARAKDATLFVVGCIRHKRDEFIRQIIEGSGDYPDVRLWAWEHLKVNAVDLMQGDPLPGWVWPKWKQKHPRMKALREGGIVDEDGNYFDANGNWQAYPDKRSRPEEEVEEPEVAQPEPKKEIEGPDPWKQGLRPLYDEIQDFTEGTTVAPKVRTVKGARLDHTKIKRPKCPVHKNEMVFDAVINKFVCNTEGCTMKASPKRSAENNDLIVGKGAVTARYICQPDGNDALVLISDDNVALDITNMVNMDAVRTKWDLDEVVKNNRGGVQTVSIPLPQKVVLGSLRLSITNLPDYKH